MKRPAASLRSNASCPPRRGPATPAVARVGQTLAALALAGLTLAPLMLIARPAEAAKRHRRVIIQCPKGAKRAVARIARQRPSTMIGVEQPWRVVACVRPDGTRHGPAAELRSRARGSNRSLARRSYFSGHYVVRFGRYDEGQRHGDWVQLDGLGNELGRVALSQGTGNWQAWHTNRTLAVQGALRAGERHGHWSWRFRSGKPAVDGQYDDGQKSGEWTWWYAVGGPMHVEAYRGNQRHGLRTSWWSGGNKREEGRYVRGLRYGAWYRWNVDGELLGINRLERGSGHMVEWFRSGEKRAEGPVVDDRRHGAWRQYDKSGLLRGEGRYRRGARVTSTWRFYDDAGRPRSTKRLSGIIGRLTTRGATRIGVLRGGGTSGLRVRGGTAVGRIGGLGLRGTGSGGGRGVAGGIARGGIGGGGIARGTRAVHGVRVRSVAISYVARGVKGVRMRPPAVKLLRLMHPMCLRRVRVATATSAPPIRGRAATARATSVLSWLLDVRATGQVRRARRITTPPGVTDRKALECVDRLARLALFTPQPSGRAFQVQLTATLQH